KFLTNIGLIMERLEKYLNESASYNFVLIELNAISSEHLALLEVVKRMKVESVCDVNFGGLTILATRLSISPLITDSFLLELIKDKKRVHLDLVCEHLTFDGIVTAAQGSLERSLLKSNKELGPTASFYVKKCIIPTLDARTIFTWKKQFNMKFCSIRIPAPFDDPTPIVIRGIQFMKVERKKSLNGENALITLGYYECEEEEEE
ncbi:hypothetical protein PFISCL1PPCAC_20300, partial [Pristionchus fissidentatus]